MNNKKRIINESLLEKELGYKSNITFTIIFVIASVIIIVLPFMDINKVNTFNLICSFVFCFLFSLMFNLVPLIQLNKKKKIVQKIREKKYKIILDEVTNIDVILSRDDDYPDKNHFLTLKYWSKKFNKEYPVFSSFFKKIKKGDLVYLIFIDNSIEPLLIFKESEYSYEGNLNNISEIGIINEKGKLAKK